MGVCADCRGRYQRPGTSRSQRVAQRLQALPCGQWRTMRWRQGPKGWRRKQCVAVRGWRVTREGQRPGGWLLGARATRGQPEERQDSWSHLSASATGEAWATYAQRRYAIAQFHAEANGEMGWDQGRLWPGFHRHTATVMLAYSCLVWLELRHRHRSRGRGRPRDLCSPAPGPTAADAASDPS
jgi:hypothetical protein